MSTRYHVRVWCMRHKQSDICDITVIRFGTQSMCAALPLAQTQRQRETECKTAADRGRDMKNKDGDEQAGEGFSNRVTKSRCMKQIHC